MEEIKIMSDGFKVYGPKVDGSYTLTFSIGEYEKNKIAQLIASHGEETNMILKITEE